MRARWARWNASSLDNSLSCSPIARRNVVFSNYTRTPVLLCQRDACKLRCQLPLAHLRVHRRGTCERGAANSAVLLFGVVGHPQARRFSPVDILCIRESRSAHERVEGGAELVAAEKAAVVLLCFVLGRPATHWREAVSGLEGRRRRIKKGDVLHPATRQCLWMMRRVAVDRRGDVRGKTPAKEKEPCKNKQGKKT